MTATSVPTWSATSKAQPEASSTSQPKKARARIRCAELETGRNSVSPWMTPSSAATSSVTTAAPAYDARRRVGLRALRGAAPPAPAGARLPALLRPCQMTTIAAAMNTLE